VSKHRQRLAPPRSLGPPALKLVGYFQVEGEEAAPPPEPPGRRRRPLRALAAGVAMLALALLFTRSTGAPPSAASRCETPPPAVLAAIAPAPPPPAPESAPDQAPAPGPPGFRVQGVVAPDVLNLRRRPGPHSTVVLAIPDDGTRIIPTGPRRQIGRALWWEVEYQGRRGWVNARFLAPDPP
jgi:hypothetical protein